MTSFEVLEIPAQIVHGNEYNILVKVDIDAMGFITNNSIFFEDYKNRTKYQTIYSKLQLNNSDYTINARIKKEDTLKLKNIDIKIGIGVSNGLFITKKEYKLFDYRFDGSKYIIKHEYGE